MSGPNQLTDDGREPFARIAELEARLQEAERYAARWRELMRRTHYIYHRAVDETTDHWEVALSLPAGPHSLAEAVDRAVAAKTEVEG